MIIYHATHIINYYRGLFYGLISPQLKLGALRPYLVSGWTGTFFANSGKSGLDGSQKYINATTDQRGYILFELLDNRTKMSTIIYGYNPPVKSWGFLSTHKTGQNDKPLIGSFPSFTGTMWWNHFHEHYNIKFDVSPYYFTPYKADDSESK